MSDGKLREYFSPLELINSVGEVVSCCISLDGKLKLSYYLIIDYNFQGYVANGNFISKSALNLL